MYIKFMNYFDALYYVNKAGHIDCVNPRKGKIIDEIMITGRQRVQAGVGGGQQFCLKATREKSKVDGNVLHQNYGGVSYMISYSRQNTLKLYS